MDDTVTVWTATGPVDPSELGVTLIHEHLLIGWPGARLDHRHPFDRVAAREKCLTTLRHLRDLGVRTIVDPCPIDLGRDAAFAADVSDASGVQVVVATGLYTEALGQPFYFRERTVEELADLFVTEIVDGIADTGVRAGVVKCAAGSTAGVSTSDRPLTEAEERVHRAAARAALETGVPVITHTDELAPAGRDQLRVFAEEGLSSDRVLIGHCGGSGDLRYFRKLLDAGASLGFDRCGVTTIAPDEQRLAAIVGLARTGHLERLFVSSDAVMWWVGAPSPAISRIQDRCPDWNAAHVLRTIVPALRDAGLGESELDQLLVGNPQRLLTPTA